MPESVTELLSQSFDAVNTFQGLIIALLAAITMRRYGNIVYFSVFAIIIDQFLTIAFTNDWGASVKDVTSQIFDSILELDATVVIIRFVGFLVVITIFYGIKALFRK